MSLHVENGNLGGARLLGHPVFLA